MQEEGSTDGRVLSSTWQAIHTGLSKATSAVTKQAKGLCTLGRGDFGKPIDKGGFGGNGGRKTGRQRIRGVEKVCAKRKGENELLGKTS